MLDPVKKQELDEYLHQWEKIPMLVDEEKIHEQRDVAEIIYLLQHPITRMNPSLAEIFTLALSKKIETEIASALDDDYIVNWFRVMEKDGVHLNQDFTTGVMTLSMRLVQQQNINAFTIFLETLKKNPDLYSTAVNTALKIAANNNQEAMMEFLLPRLVKDDERDATLRTCIMHALQENPPHTHIIKKLLSVYSEEEKHKFLHEMMAIIDEKDKPFIAAQIPHALANIIHHALTVTDTKEQKESIETIKMLIKADAELDDNIFQYQPTIKTTIDNVDITALRHLRDNYLRAQIDHALTTTNQNEQKQSIKRIKELMKTNVDVDKTIFRYQPHLKAAIDNLTITTLHNIHNKYRRIQEEIPIKKMGHIQGKEFWLGNIQSEGEKAEDENAISTLQNLKEDIDEFAKTFNYQSIFTPILNAFQAPLDFIRSDDITAMHAKYKAGEMIVIPAGWREIEENNISHSLTLGFCNKNMLFVIDRSGGMNIPGYVGIYLFDTNRITNDPESLRSLINNVWGDRKWPYLIPQQVQKEVNSFKLRELIHFNFKPQQHGTCSYVNKKSAVLPMLFILIFEELFKKSNPKETLIEALHDPIYRHIYLQAKNISQNMYKDMTKFIRDMHIEWEIHELQNAIAAKEDARITLQINLLREFLKKDEQDFKPFYKIRKIIRKHRATLALQEFFKDKDNARVLEKHDHSFLTDYTKEKIFHEFSQGNIDDSFTKTRNAKDFIYLYQPGWEKIFHRIAATAINLTLEDFLELLQHPIAKNDLELTRVCIGRVTTYLERRITSFIYTEKDIIDFFEPWRTNNFTFTKQFLYEEIKLISAALIGEKKYFQATETFLNILKDNGFYQLGLAIGIIIDNYLDKLTPQESEALIKVIVPFVPKEQRDHFIFPLLVKALQENQSTLVKHLLTAYTAEEINTSLFNKVKAEAPGQETRLKSFVPPKSPANNRFFPDNPTPASPVEFKSHSRKM